MLLFPEVPSSVEMDVKIAPFKCEKGIAQADKGVVPGHTGSAGIQGRHCGTVPASRSGKVIVLCWSCGRGLEGGRGLSRHGPVCRPLRVNRFLFWEPMPDERGRMLLAFSLTANFDIS